MKPSAVATSGRWIFRLFAATSLLILGTARLQPVEAIRRHKAAAQEEPVTWPMDRLPHNSTLAVRTLVTSKFARCQSHSVQLPDGRVVHDWIYLDERPHVNILVRLKADGDFVVFRQQKYATGETLAPVGGFIENGETAISAARRELWEELGLQAHRLHELGSFVTSANRGGGRVHVFYADHCAPAANNRSPRRATARGRADAESQLTVKLTREQLMTALLSGQFQEVKWTATIALALLQQQAGSEDAAAAAAASAPSVSESGGVSIT